MTPGQYPCKVRVVSLLPSATEIVCALGARDDLVGRSHECDYPPSVSALPVLTRSRIAPLPGSSGEIDRAARVALREDLPIYDVDVELLSALRPDVILTQDLCNVCAASFEQVHAAKEVAARNVKVVNLGPRRLEHIWVDIARTAEALDRREAGRRLVHELRERVSAVARRAEAISARPSVLTVEWLDPLMVGGLWMPELVHLAGGKPLVTKRGERSATITGEQLRALDPDVVLVKPCGFGLTRALEEIALVREPLPRRTHGGVGTRARVFVADGNAFFNRAGPRIADSLEILAACMHPEELGDLGEPHRAAFTRVMQ